MKAANQQKCTMVETTQLEDKEATGHGVVQEQWSWIFTPE